jgi:excisionase family DNA binding protein
MTDSATTSDLLYGGDAIADFLGISRRAAYHLIERKRVPYFKIGRTVCARRANLLAEFERLEQEPLPAA